MRGLSLEMSIFDTKEGYILLVDTFFHAIRLFNRNNYSSSNLRQTTQPLRSYLYLFHIFLPTYQGAGKLPPHPPKAPTPFPFGNACAAHKQAQLQACGFAPAFHPLVIPLAAGNPNAFVVFVPVAAELSADNVTAAVALFVIVGEGEATAEPPAFATS